MKNREVLTKVVERHWAGPLDAGLESCAQSLDALRDELATVDFADLLELAFVAGERGCPISLSDVAAQRVLEGALDSASADRPVHVVPGGPVVPEQLRVPGFVSDRSLVVHVQDSHVTAYEIESSEPVSSIGRPAWRHVVLAANPVTASVSEETRRRAMAAWQLVSLSQLLGAASRSHELAVEHARTRKAFGKPIGTFQAVAHRAVGSAIRISGSRSLLADAWRTVEDDASPSDIATDLAVRQCLRVIPEIVHRSGETLGAAGYFEEHEFPWIFRLVHGGLAWVRPAVASEQEAFDRLVAAAGKGLPALPQDEGTARFRQEVAQFALRHEPPEGTVMHLDNVEDRSHVEVTEDAVSMGFLTLGWPTEFGGRDAPVEHQIALAEELTYRRVPLGARIDADLVGTAIYLHGGQAQRERFLPMIAAGKLNYYTAYSEPETGSDLAQVQTFAEQDGDDWIITGTKAWGTRAQNAEFAWVLARTSHHEGAPHRGLTMFLVPCRDADGWSYEEHVGLNGEISCTTTFDRVRVSDVSRIGDVDKGWRVLMSSLAKIRNFMASSAASMDRYLDDVLVEFRSRHGAAPAAQLDGSQVATALQVAADIQIARSLVRVSAADASDPLAAAVAKLVACEVYRDLSEWAYSLFGAEAAIGEGGEAAVLGGAVEYNLRYTLMQTLAGGTPDIQRNQIARILGLG